MVRLAIRGTVLLFIVAAFCQSQASANTVCDLTLAGSSCTITGGTGTGLFFQDEQQPTGTGYIDSFLRLQQNGWEQGYNTSDRSYSTPGGMQPIIQDKTDPNFTRDLPLANIGTKTIAGIKYAEFFLDVNEQATTNGGKSLISLDQLEIFKSNVALTHPSYSNSGNNNGTGSLTGSNGGTTKVYDMDSGTSDNWVQIDYNVSGGGSGQSDMVFYLPYSYLTGAKYVYLYSEFGNIDGTTTQPKKYLSGAGFEEWWTMSPSLVQPLNAVPEPSSIALLGIGLIVLGRRWQRKPPSVSKA